MPTGRGTIYAPGADKRGSNKDRKRRRNWLLSCVKFGGDGKHVKCFHCGTLVDYTTMQVDRYPRCGHNGGDYRRNNIVPSCVPCNANRCKGCGIGEEHAEQPEAGAGDDAGGASPGDEWPSWW